MASFVTKVWHGVVRPGRLAGPLFDKELRVASRRRKYYLLRFAYVCLLAIVVRHFWDSFVRVGGPGPMVAQVARMGAAGRGVSVTIIWFQFIAAQVLAAVLLSDAISGEIRRRTLEDLLVTPIRGIHVILGKLLGGLLHVILLVGISLPVLAVARALGGVPWDYLVSGLCITLSASVFAGALSLLCSTIYRQASRVVVMVGLWYVALWGLDGLQLLLLPWTLPVGNRAGAMLWSLVSPLHALYVRTQTMLAGPSPASPCVALAPHCLTTLLAAMILLVLSARRVRRVIPALIRGPADEGPEAMRVLQSEAGKVVRRTRAGALMRQGLKTPLLWWDLSLSLFPTRVFDVVLWLIVGGLALFTGQGRRQIFVIPISALQWLFIIRLGVAAAGSITREKQAHTWAILLTTPLDEGEILIAKAGDALRRTLALLVPLVSLYWLAFVSGIPWQQDLPDLVLHVAVPVIHLAGTIVLLLGTGLSAGIHCRTATGAIAMVLGSYFCLAFVASPLFAGVLGVPVPARGAHGYDAAMPGLLVAYVYGGLGSYLLLNAARELRRNVV